MVFCAILTCMYNWSVDENQLRAEPERYEKWKLEQMINFGLGSEKLSARLLRKHWRTLELDPTRRRLLELFLYGSAV